MKPDIKNRADVELFILEFYANVRGDEAIAYLFSSVAKTNWEHHTPIIIDFWESLLLGAMKYHGGMMAEHFKLNRLEKLTPVHFERWIFHFENAIKNNFEGPVAEDAITRAHHIKNLMQFKLSQVEAHS